ncbi:unnamed protein product [Psylliodes chrysocephalus]|uniref:Complex 1 LYR protein domain-containing protein n=1 Tax=Psylliodes chrysocephalus TaxID=3402493 RepID=A0A9P0CKH9_9CUCU|nr:unnamed protein product [Psylliodes chrysocephala]
MASKTKTLQLYRTMLRESSKIPSYNFREYAIRKIRDTFKQNKQCTESTVIQNQLKEAQRNLEIIKRQAIVGQLYSTEKLVIEYTT